MQHCTTFNLVYIPEIQETSPCMPTLFILALQVLAELFLPIEEVDACKLYTAERAELKELG